MWSERWRQQWWKNKDNLCISIFLQRKKIFLLDNLFILPIFPSVHNMLLCYYTSRTSCFCATRKKAQNNYNFFKINLEAFFKLIRSFHPYFFKQASKPTCKTFLTIFTFYFLNFFFFFELDLLAYSFMVGYRQSQNEEKLWQFLFHLFA